MSEESLQRIEEKLDVIIRLMGSIVIENGNVEGVYKRAQKLASLGLERKLIAEILRTTMATVAVALSPSKARKKKKGKKNAAPKEDVVTE